MNWTKLLETAQPLDAPYEPERCHTPKCQLCGRFTRSLRLVWTGGAEPEPDYEVGECCDPRLKNIGK